MVVLPASQDVGVVVLAVEAVTRFPFAQVVFVVGDGFRGEHAVFGSGLFGEGQLQDRCPPVVGEQVRVVVRPPDRVHASDRRDRLGDDGVARCAWATSDPLYLHYHDREWGFPVADDRRLFEKICLEGFQAGLSWITILRKRENFRKAFSGFEPAAVARFTTRDVQRLLKEARILLVQS